MRQPHLCSKPGCTNPAKPGQSVCKPCHAAYMRDRRAAERIERFLPWSRACDFIRWSPAGHLLRCTHCHVEMRFKKTNLEEFGEDATNFYEQHKHCQLGAAKPRDALNALPPP